MSFLKFWGKKAKAKDDLDAVRREETDAEAEKRKLRHTLSISRSGRFKQKKRERGGILDRPELYGTEGVEGEYKEFKDYQEHSMCSETSSSASTTSTSSSSSTSRPPAPSSASNSTYTHPAPRRSSHSMAT